MQKGRNFIILVEVEKSSLLLKMTESQKQAKRLLGINTNITNEEVSCMDLLWTIVVILVILWLLGYGFGYLGSIIHILLVIAIIVVLVRIIQGRRPV